MNWDVPAWTLKPDSPVQNALRWLIECKRKLVRPREARRLRVLETVPVGDRRIVVLLQVDQQDYLLASSTAGVTLLTPVVHPPAPTDEASSKATASGEHPTETTPIAFAANYEASFGNNEEGVKPFAAHMKLQHGKGRVGNVCAISTPVSSGSPEAVTGIAEGTPNSLLFPAAATPRNAPVVERRRKRKATASSLYAWLLVAALVFPLTHRPAYAQAATSAASSANAADAPTASSNAAGQQAAPSLTNSSTSPPRNSGGSRLPAPAANPANANLSINGLGSSSAPWTIVVLLTLLTLIPSLMICVTPFARLLVVFHFLRQALGLQTTPSNQTLIGLSLILTFFIMEPVGKQIYNTGFLPMQAGQITALEAVSRGSEPLRHFMAHYVREKDASLFLDIAHAPRPRSIEDVSMRVLMPAYIVSELKAGFQIGAVLFLPFLVVDIVIASITTSVGMMQLPPVVISTPLKLMLFLMVDGWHLLIGSLVRSFY